MKATLDTFDHLTHSEWVNGKYEQFYKSHGYLPRFFEVYNGLEITDVAPTLSTRSNGAMGSGTVLVIEVVKSGGGNATWVLYVVLIF